MKLKIKPNKAKSKNAFLYAFDNIEQYKMFQFSYESLNDIETDFILVIKEKVFKENELIFTNEIKDKNIYLYTLDNNLKGMFYWLIAAAYLDYEYLLQIDNDTFAVNFKIEELIKKYEKKSKKKIFLGTQSYGWTNPKNYDQISLYRKNKVDFLLKTFKYINTGVVLINVEKLKLQKEKINLENLEKYAQKMKNNKNRCTDQEYINSFFWNECGFIRRKNNIRLSDINDFSKIKNFDNSIIHYNLHRVFDNKWEKVDFLNKYENLDNEEFSDYLTEFWHSSEKHNRKNKKLYKKKILSILKTI